MPQLDEQLPAFQLSSADGVHVGLDDLVSHGAVVLAAVSDDGHGDPRAAVLADLAQTLGEIRLVVVSSGPSQLGGTLADGWGATWLQDPTGDAFAALGLTDPDPTDAERLGGLFVVDAERRLRFAFATADREGWIPASFVLARLERLGLAATDAPGSPAESEPELEAELELELLVGAVGRRIGLDAAALADLATATRMRDIGMSTVPDAIITKDGPLDDEEWQLIRMHPDRSAEMLDSRPDLDRVRATVRASHEHLDGTGYPHGLAGDAIPVESRILLAVESFLAMTRDHPYGGILSPAEGLDRIRARAGSIYDPTVVSALASEVGAEPTSLAA
jgi:HD domain